MADSEKSGDSSIRKATAPVEPPRHYLVKLQGGPPKVVRACRDLSAPQLHQAYMGAIVLRGRTAAENPEDEFPECRLMTEAEVTGPTYRHLFQASSVDPERYPSIIEVT
jgi:hypothetical protein